MSDDKSKKGHQDRNQVNGSEDYEVEYFAQEMGVTPQQVRDAIQQTGSNQRDALEKYLKGK